MSFRILQFSFLMSVFKDRRPSESVVEGGMVSDYMENFPLDF